METLSTSECADRLNQLYGHAVVSRHRVKRDIEAGRLPAITIPASGSRERSRHYVTPEGFEQYIEAYHPEAWATLRSDT